MAAAVAAGVLLAPATRPGATTAPRSVHLSMPPELGELHHPFGHATPLAPGPDAANPDVPVAPEGGLPRAEPAVAVAATDPRLVVVGMNDYNAVSPPGATLYTSSNGGRTFRGPVPWALHGDAVDSGDPSLAAAPSGAMYFSYAEYGAPRTNGVGGIYVARSPDGGRHWNRRETRVAVDDLTPTNGRCHFNDKDEITVAPDGDVYLAWSDFNYDSSQTCGSGSPAMLARSTDGGRHFRSVMVSAPSDDTNAAMPRVGKDGTVFVAYGAYRYIAACGRRSYGEDIVVARSTDHGRSFRRTTAIAGLCLPMNPSTTGGTYRTYSMPTFEVLDDGTLVLATVGQVGVTSQLLVTRSVDHGRTWHAVTTPAMQPGAQYHMPRMTRAGSTLVLTYIEQQPGGLYSCRLATSKDAGTTWSAPQTVSSEVSFGTNAYQYDGDYIGVAVGSDGIAHPAWTDIRVPAPHVGGEDIWTRRVPITP